MPGGAVNWKRPASALSAAAAGAWSRGEQVSGVSSSTRAPGKPRFSSETSPSTTTEVCASRGTTGGSAAWGTGEAAVPAGVGEGTDAQPNHAAAAKKRRLFENSLLFTFDV